LPEHNPKSIGLKKNLIGQKGFNKGFTVQIKTLQMKQNPS
jgi:hypothetical protein